MSSNLDIYKEYLEASRANPPSSNLEAAERYFTADFQTLDIDGNVQMTKEAYLGLTQLLFTAFQDFKTVVQNIHEEDGVVILRSHFEGTHTGDLDLSALGVGVLPASGKKIVWPEARSAWKFDGGKIASVQATNDNSGLGPFLAPLGVKLPSA